MLPTTQLNVLLPLVFTECIELIGDQVIRVINTYNQPVDTLAVNDFLFIEFQGPTESLISKSIKLAKGIEKQHEAKTLRPPGTSKRGRLCGQTGRVCSSLVWHSCMYTRADWRTSGGCSCKSQVPLRIILILRSSCEVDTCNAGLMKLYMILKV